MTEIVPTTLTPEAVARQRGAMNAARRQIGPTARDDEWHLFLEVSLRLGLSPFRDEICLVPYGGVHKAQVTVHGRRVLARRTGQLRGIVGPYWCGPHHPNPDSPLEWVDAWVDDRPPHAARVIVHRAGEEPYTGTAPWRIFVKDTPAWRAMDSHMLGKVAETIALRRAFPDVVIDDAVFEYDDAETEPPPSYRPVGADAAGGSLPPPRPGSYVDARALPDEMHLSEGKVLADMRRMAERLEVPLPTELGHVDARVDRAYRDAYGAHPDDAR
jgi:hypothetical protein